MRYIKLFESREEEIENLKNIFLEDGNELFFSRIKLLEILNNYLGENKIESISIGYLVANINKHYIVCKFFEKTFISKDLFLLTQLVEDLKDFNNYIDECELKSTSSIMKLIIHTTKNTIWNT